MAVVSSLLVAGVASAPPADATSRFDVGWDATDVPFTIRTETYSLPDPIDEGRVRCGVAHYAVYDHVKYGVRPGGGGNSQAGDAASNAYLARVSSGDVDTTFLVGRPSVTHFYIGDISFGGSHGAFVGGYNHQHDPMFSNPGTGVSPQLGTPCSDIFSLYGTFGEGRFGADDFGVITHPTWQAGETEPAPTLDVSVPSASQEIGDQVPVSVTLSNPAELPLESLVLSGGSGLLFDPQQLDLVSGPTPAAPATLAAGQSVTLDYVVEPLTSGALPVRAVASGVLDGENVSVEGTANVNVLPLVEVELSTSVTEATKVGDEFDVIATVTNNEEVEVTDIKAESLAVDPGGLAEYVSGPLNEAGNDPRLDPVTIPAGGSATIRWTYGALARGEATFTGGVSGRDPYAGSLFFLDGSTTVAIEAPGIEITDFRMQPGAPVPGQFGNLRGTITNVGSVEVRDLDFEMESNPRTVILEQRMEDGGLSPRIEVLEPGESREFLIPFGMVLDVQEFGAYTVDLTMNGTATVDGDDVDVGTDARTAGALDLSEYWTNIFDEVGRQLRDGFFELFEGVNDWGDSSTLGGVSVGSAQGVITAFQKMGDGILTAGELVVTEEGRTRLTKTGKQVVAAIREYVHTTTPKKMIIDFADVRDDVTIGAVGTFADWMFTVEKAASEGDYRQVSSLLTESGTQFATGVGVEAAAGQLFAKFMSTAVARTGLSYLKRAPKTPVEGPDVPDPNYERIVDAEYDDLTDIPTGVSLSGQTVARAGLTVDEHAWMIEMAKEHGVAFFVRPRPSDAAKWARLGYNAKPMAIKFKSVNDIDAKWLGYDEFADMKGVVVVRKPVEPLDAMQEAVERGELEWGGKEIDDIIKRYNTRRAEWEQLDEVISELNAQNGGEGFDIQRYGRTIRTKVTVDAGGVLRMTWNNKPIFSDIDLLAIARPDGSPIDPDLHDQITRAGGFGIDGQHGDSTMTSDFPNWKVAEKVAVPYIFEHRRGGEPLVIVQADVTTLGYVDQVTLPATAPEGSGYDLYGQVKVTYEGAGSR